jgi:hypothetical protein
MNSPFSIPACRPIAFRPGRLWSLWELFDLDAKRFYEAIHLLTGVTCTIQAAIHAVPASEVDTLRRGHGADIEENLERLGHDLVAMQLPMTKKSFDRLREMHRLPPHPGGDRLKLAYRTYNITEERDALLEVHRRLKDELETRWFLAMSPAEAELYLTREPLFGAAVERAFPLASEDISEAGKCMSLGRYTASVFHLMRAMERALHKMGGKLDATIVDKYDRTLSWGIIIANIDGKISKMQPGDEQRKWSEARALLYHVNQAWRTDTMHPKQTYTEPEARDVLAAVKSFMGRLSALV